MNDDCYVLETVRPMYNWVPAPGFPPSLFIRDTPSSENFKEFLTYRQLFYDSIVLREMCKKEKPLLGVSDVSQKWIYECNQVYHSLTHEEAILLINYKTLFNDLIRLDSNPHLPKLFRLALKPKIPNFFPIDSNKHSFWGWYSFDILQIHDIAWKLIFKSWKKQPIEWIIQKLNTYLETPIYPNLFMVLYREYIALINNNGKFRPNDFITQVFNLNLNDKGKKFFVPYLAKALDIWYPEPLIFILLNYIERHIKNKQIKKLFVEGFDSKSFQNQFLKLAGSIDKQYQLFTREAIVYFDFSRHWIKLAQVYVKRFERLFRKFPPLPTPLAVYRGVDQIESFYTFSSWKGFTSTTLDPQIARNYMGSPDENLEQCCMLEITIPMGMRVLPILTMKNDGREILEILLPNDSKVMWSGESEECKVFEGTRSFTVKTFNVNLIE
jgi:hypothetical protein